MNNQAFSKIWILIIALFLLSGGVLTWWYTKPQSQKETVLNESVNWKIFSSERYNYEIKYPQILEIDKDGDIPIKSWLFPSVDDSEQVFRTIFLVVKDSSKKSSALSFARRNLGVCQTEKDLSDYARISCDNESQKTISSVYLKNNKAYIISLETMDGNYFTRTEPMNFSSEIEIYDSMLSTFGFLE